MRSSHWRSRSASRDRDWTWASTWWAKSTGWACWRWVRPGMATSGWASARPTSASWRSAIRPPMIRAWSRRYIRKSVATWSLRDRPARSLPPRSGPSRSSRPRSRAVCTSSSAMVPTKAPSATSASSWSRPGEHAGQLVLGEQARLVQHARVGAGAGDVVGGEPPVEVDGRGQLRQGLGGAVGETAAPEPYVTAVAAHCVAPQARGVPPPPHPCREEAGVPLPTVNDAAYARSRLAAIFEDRPKMSMKPWAADWSKVSPVS